MDDHDLQIVRLSLAGEQTGFEALYSNHAGRVMAYLLRSGFSRADAEDLTQETFIRAFKSLHTFDANRGRFGTWLATIARNVARKQWSRRKNPENFDPELAEEFLTSPDNPGATVAATEEIDAVGACVEFLPGELARIVRLRYVYALTTRTIAAEVSLPEATVRLRLKEAVDALRRCLEGKGFLE